MPALNSIMKEGDTNVEEVQIFSKKTQGETDVEAERGWREHNAQCTLG